MIKFFRHIRKSLLEQNKKGKYLKYAVGEIILVVIGILIALQVNNWNNQRVQKKKESEFIGQIHEEFKMNKEQFKKVTSYHLRCKKAATRIQYMMPIDIKSINIDTLAFYLKETLYSWTFNPQQTSINSLTNSASFDIISNNELKILLQQWNELIKDYSEEEINFRNQAIDYYVPYLTKKINFGTFLSSESMLNHKSIQLDFLNDLEFENLVHIRDIKVQDILNESQMIQDAIDKIIQLSTP